MADEILYAGLTPEELIQLLGERDLKIANNATTISNHETTIKDLEDKVASQEVELEKSLEANKLLTATIESGAFSAEVPAAKTASAVSDCTFTVDGSEYGFKKKRLDFNGSIITAEHVLVCQDLQAQLVASKSGMIYLVKAAEQVAEEGA